MDDMHKFEVKEMMMKRPFAESTWNDWLINNISEHLKKDGWCKIQNSVSFENKHNQKL